MFLSELRRSKQKRFKQLRILSQASVVMKVSWVRVCVCMCVCVCVCVCVLVAQLCPNLWGPINCSLPGSFQQCLCLSILIRRLSSERRHLEKAVLQCFQSNKEIKEVQISLEILFTYNCHSDLIILSLRAEGSSEFLKIWYLAKGVNLC